MMLFLFFSAISSFFTPVVFRRNPTIDYFRRSFALLFALPFSPSRFEALQR
jgi:hypothetical protein